MQRAERLAERTGRGLPEVLAETIELSLRPLGAASEPLIPAASMSDDELLAETAREMPSSQDARLSELLHRQQAGKLAEGEQRELTALMNVYQQLLLRKAKAPLVIAGGGVLYSGAEATLSRLAERAGLPVAETQAGKGALAWDHVSALGSIGVTGSSAANEAAAEADAVVAIGTRLQDFTTGSRTLFEREGCTIVQVNVASHDAVKHRA